MSIFDHPINNTPANDVFELLSNVLHFLDYQTSNNSKFKARVNKLYQMPEDDILDVLKEFVEENDQHIRNII